jgi:hypothetical protein
MPDQRTAERAERSYLSPAAERSAERAAAAAEELTAAFVLEAGAVRAFARGEAVALRVRGLSLGTELVRDAAELLLDLQDAADEADCAALEREGRDAAEAIRPHLELMAGRSGRAPSTAELE